MLFIQYRDHTINIPHVEYIEKYITRGFDGDKATKVYGLATSLTSGKVINLEFGSEEDRDNLYNEIIKAAEVFEERKSHIMVWDAAAYDTPRRR